MVSIFEMCFLLFCSKCTIDPELTWKTEKVYKSWGWQILQIKIQKKFYFRNVLAVFLNAQQHAFTVFDLKVSAYDAQEPMIYRTQ